MPLCTTATPNLPDGTDYEAYSYDANGNMTLKRKRDGKTIASSYDALNRVTSKAPQGQPAVSYTYDLAGRQKTIDFATGGHLVQHGYDTAGRLITTSDNGRILNYSYDAAGNRTKVQWPDGYSADYAYDALNRVTTIKENNLTALATYAYDAAGRRIDIETGFYYNRARYDSSQLGRFLSADPIGYGDGLNMYAYARNTPP